MFLYQLGTDQLEKLFSLVRTITHARNCDSRNMSQIVPCWEHRVNPPETPDMEEISFQKVSWLKGRHIGKGMVWLARLGRNQHSYCLETRRNRSNSIITSA